MSEKIRSFIAIELNKDIQSNLAKIQSELRISGGDVKWVEPKNIHLTLKFLGDIAIDSITKIKNILVELAKNHKKFPIDITELGAFPSIKNPRVIWVGIEKGKENIGLIADELENNLSNIGIPKEERKFQAHITIGRVKSPLDRLRLIETLNKNINISILNFTVEKLTLFKSTLTPQGPIYEAIAETNLKAS